MVRSLAGLGRYGAALLLSAATAAVSADDVAPPNSAEHPLRVWQSTPGATYNSSFLVGNSRLGFSLGGDPLSEGITLNEDSFWSGGPMDRANPDAAAYMPELQSLIREGELVEASRLASMSYAATPVSVRHYDWLGDLNINMRGGGGSVEDYERWLDLEEGIAGVYYTRGGVAFQREYTASFPDDVIAVRIAASEPGAVSFDLHQSRGKSLNRFMDWSEAVDGDTLLMASGSGGADAILFVAGAKVVTDGGSVKTIGDTVVVEGADAATIYWTSWTTVRKGADELRDAVLGDLQTVSQKSYEDIRADHLEDYQALAGRVDLDLGASSEEQRAMSTFDRMAALEDVFDPELSVLYFAFGRYLLITSGRPGTLPANLQGIWNNDLNPQWGSKYTININLQMNYWPSTVTNMPELHDSMLAHLKLMHENGKGVARDMYNASGSVCHHNTDLWGDCAPQDNYAASSFWPVGLAWMATHIYEHYLFTGDTDVLREYYPVLRDSAVFFLDYLTEYEGWLVTNPSVSPEISYQVPNTTDVVALSLGPTCDNSILWEIFGMVLESQEILGPDAADSDLAAQIEAVRARLPPLRKNQHGGIAEWIEDFTEDEPDHRHFSQLFGLFPGSQITSANETTFEAARSSLRRRLDLGSGDTGWSRAWAVALEARLFNASGVAVSYKHLLTELAYPSSLLGINEPSMFQLDGNYGAVTLVEALVQSHELVSEGTGGNGTGSLEPVYVGDSEGGKTAHSLLRLLPALPEEWAANGGGHATGLLARGGFEVDIFWDENARLTNATLKSLQGNTAWVTLGQVPVTEADSASDASTISIEGEDGGVFVKLETEKGESYTVTRG